VTEERPVPPNPADIARQLRAAADRLMAGWTAAAGAVTGKSPSSPGVPDVPAVPGLPGMPGVPPMPATMSAARMEALLEDLAARRAQVQALRGALEGFDEQLGALEASLRPVLEWTRTWAGMESAIGEFWRPSSGGGPGT
jgi:hypothetical protein